MGFIDLEVYPLPEESARLGIPPGWVVIDYKSTKNLRWVKSPEDLRKDPQAALYAYAHMHSDRSIWHGRPATELLHAPDPCPPQRWIYFQTVGPRKAQAVDVRPAFRDAVDRVHLMVQQAKHLDMLESIDQCTPNPSACPEFGGCEFHVSKGGPCTAERRLGAAVNQVVRLQQKKDTPPMSNVASPAQTRFQQLAAARRANLGQAPAAEAPPPAPAPAPAPPPAAAPATNSFGAPAAPAPAAPRTRRAPAAAAPPPPPPAPVQEAPAAATAPVYRFTIECGDPAELAAIVEIVNQALAQ
jgi:hypothetical protein